MLCKRQRGVALLVALVVLTITLILGVSSYQNSRLEEAMAGNQRASALALMAAEYGASEFWGEVSGAAIDASDIDADDPAYDEYDKYYKEIVNRLGEWVTEGGVDGRPWHETCVTAGDGSDYSGCYTVSLGGLIDNKLLEVNVDGIVVSGPPAGLTFNSSSSVSTFPTNLVARRRIKTLWKVSLGESLSPLNLAGEVSYYNGLSSQAEVYGEVVDGYVNPAISVKSKADAEEIVKNILKTDSLVGNTDVVFVPDSDGSDGEGVFHDSSVVDMVDGQPVYTGDYSNCDGSVLCNYKGGIASSLGTPILTDERVDDFDAFITAAVDVNGTSDLGAYKTPVWLTEAEVTSKDADAFVNSPEGAGDQVYFITNQDVANGYARPVWDDYKVTDSKLTGQDTGSEVPRMEKPLIELGGFNKSGVLIIDGDVEFSGDPEFEGLIVVLGDYTIDGSGSSPFTGSIISAPYSITYTVTEVTGDTAKTKSLIPNRDNQGNLLDSDGNVLRDSDGNILAGDAIVASDNNGYPVIMNADGSIVADVAPSFVADDGIVYSSGDLDPEPQRQFDPLGLSINGGGKQPYNYDYQVLQGAIDLLSDEARLKLLIGQRRLDGSYEYGLRSWSEVVPL